MRANRLYLNRATWIALILLGAWGCVRQTQPTLSDSSQVTPPVKTSPRISCTELGSGWFPAENACQKGSLFALTWVIPATPDQTLRDKEEDLADWTEDEFARKADLTIVSMPAPCAGNEHTACIKTLGQTQSGEISHILGLSDGRVVLFLWQKNKKPETQEGIRILTQLKASKR